MIGFVKGNFLYSDSNRIVIDVHGVGYEITVKPKELNNLKVGVEYSLFIQTIFKEMDGFELYGFSSLKEKNIFNHLISVSKVGPKVSMAILDDISPEELISAIIDKQINSLSKIKGIGSKTSERIILELSDKFKKLFKDISPQKVSLGHNFFHQIEDLNSILANLGYSPKQIKVVIESFKEEDFKNNNFEDIIKQALKRIGSV